MKVIEFPKGDPESLRKFLDKIAEGETRPGFYLGLDTDGEPVLHLGELTWRDLLYLKASFDMHVTRDWIGWETP